MRYLCFVLLLFLCTTVSAAEVFYTEQFPPYNYYDRGGEFTGLSYEIVSELQKLTGHKYNLTVSDWDNAYKHTLSNPSAALFSVARFAERENLFQWVGPLCNFKLSLFTSAGGKIHPRSREEAKKLRIGIYNQDQAKLLKSQGFTNLVLAESDEQNIIKLLLGEIDLWLANPLAASQQCTAIGVNPLKLQQTLPISESQLYLAFNKNAPKEVVAKFAAAFKQLESNGTLTKIRKRYESGEYPLAGTAKSKEAKIFKEDSQQLQNKVESNVNLNLVEYDFPEYQITEQIAKDAVALYKKDPKAAIAEFKKHGKFFNIKHGRYVVITGDKGQCTFNAAFPFRAGKKFNSTKNTRQKLGSKENFWSYKTRLHPATGEYVPQFFYAIPFKTKEGKTNTLYLSIAGAELPFDRHFAITMADKAAAMISALGIEQAAKIINNPAADNPFRVLSGAGVFIDSSKGVILANSLTPTITGKNLWNLRDSEGNFPVRMTIRKALSGGGWLSGFFPPEDKKADPIYKLVYVRTARHGDNKYVVGSTVVPHELTRSKFDSIVFQFDRLIKVWTGMIKGKFELARKLKDAGLSYQPTLIIPAEVAEQLNNWEKFGNLAGARAFDFCYASVFNHKDDALKFALEADRLWRDELMAEELFDTLEGFSFGATARSAVKDPQKLQENFRKMNSKLLEECLRHEENMQLALSVIYGSFTEGLYISSALLKTSTPEQTKQILEDYRQIVFILNKISQITEPLDMPVLRDLKNRLTPVMPILNKEQLTEADISQLNDYAKIMRKRMLSDN